MIIVVMGVTGTGKTTIGKKLAEHLSILFFVSMAAAEFDGIPLSVQNRPAQLLSCPLPFAKARTGS